MGKKRKTQEVQRGPKKLKTYNCPVCHQPGCVKVQIKREQDKKSGEMMLIGTCSCNDCGRKHKVYVTPMDSQHQVYMRWVQHLRDLNHYGVRCPDCQAMCVLYLTDGQGDQQNQLGEIQCTRCRMTYQYLLQAERTRGELAERINKYKSSYLNRIPMDSVLGPGRRSASQRRSQERNEGRGADNADNDNHRRNQRNRDMSETEETPVSDEQGDSSESLGDFKDEPSSIGPADGGDGFGDGQDAGPAPKHEISDDDL